MSKKDDALQLALEALNRGETKLRYEAIAAIKEALAEHPAQPEQCQCPACKIAPHASDCAVHNEPAYLKGACSCKAQPEQEPVHFPVTDNTYNYAKNLAEAIFKQHFASDEHYASGRIVWGVNDTVIGILTQIDNMVADMVRRPAQQEPVALPEKIYEFVPTPEPIKWHHPECEGQCIACLIEQVVQEAYGSQGLGYLQRHLTSPQPSKPLTDEEIAKIAEKYTEPLLFRVKDFARAIEAAHGIIGEQK